MIYSLPKSQFNRQPQVYGTEQRVVGTILSKLGKGVELLGKGGWAAGGKTLGAVGAVLTFIPKLVKGVNEARKLRKQAILAAREAKETLGFGERGYVDRVIDNALHGVVRTTKGATWDTIRDHTIQPSKEIMYRTGLLSPEVNILRHYSGMFGRMLKYPLNVVGSTIGTMAGGASNVLGFLKRTMQNEGDTWEAYFKEAVWGNMSAAGKRIISETQEFGDRRLAEVAALASGIRGTIGNVVDIASTPVRMPVEAVLGAKDLLLSPLALRTTEEKIKKTQYKYMKKRGQFGQQIDQNPAPEGG